MSVAGRLGRVWHKLTEPSASIQELDRRRQARLLSSLLVALIVLVALATIFSLLSKSSNLSLQDPDLGATLIGLAVMLVVYRLSRTRFYTLAAVLTVAASSIATFAIALPEESPDDITVLVYLSMSVLLGSMLLSVRGTIILVAANVAGVLLFPLFVPQVAFVSIIDLMGFVSVVSALVIVAMRHRDLLERDRRLELSKSERRLAILREIDQAILRAQSPEAIAQAALRHVRELVPCQWASVVAFDFEAGQGTVLSIHTNGEVSLGPGAQLPLADLSINEGMRDKVRVVEEIVTPDTRPPAVQRLRAEGLRSHIGVSLIVQDQLIGALYLGADAPAVFTPEHVEIACAVADQLAIVLQQRQLRQELQLHMENLEALVGERTAELQRALERAQDADRLKSKFISNVSHELRTPLTNLKLYLRLLSRGRPEKREAYMDTLDREVGRLRDLIENLLDLSRLDLGKTRVSLQPVDLNLLVNTLAADREALVAERGLSLCVKPAEGPTLALADPKLLEQVLTNLLTNAVNYTPKGGEIWLRTAMAEAEGQRWVTASVADSGPGIAKAERAHLFERFYRGQAGRASDTPGTGLGLAICQEIMQLHDGRITLESEVGQGSTFTVWLQIAPRDG